MSDFSSLRASMVELMQVPAKTPFDIEKLKGDARKQAELLNFSGLNSRTLGITDKLLLGQKLDKLMESGDDKKVVPFEFHDDVGFIGWTLAKGICDDQFLPVFQEGDLDLIRGPYQVLMLVLCWEVLETNGFLGKQELVGNSERTETSLNSSESQQS